MTYLQEEGLSLWIRMNELEKELLEYKAHSFHERLAGLYQERTDFLCKSKPPTTWDITQSPIPRVDGPSLSSSLSASLASSIEAYHQQYLSLSIPPPQISCSSGMT
jgi:hypothetical protein